MKPCRVALLGTGTVGSGVVELLRSRAAEIAAAAGRPVELAAVAELDAARAKAAGVPAKIVTDDAAALARREDIDLVVELVGGTTAAREFVLAALAAGKPVVTANKALLAEHGEEVWAAAAKGNVPVAFEASVCGGIPLLLSLQSLLAANRLRAVVGIVNGTTNYILSAMTGRGASFEEALRAAQEAGYAEADPSLDVDGLDSAHKLAILARLAFGAGGAFDRIAVEGVREVTPEDVHHAREMGCVVKLLAVARRTEAGLELRVAPTLIPESHPLAAVGGVYNAVAIEADAAGRLMFYGRGAGREPTASAVCADIALVARGAAHVPAPGADGAPVLDAGETVTRFLLRFGVRDEHGVLGRIATALG